MPEDGDLGIDTTAIKGVPEEVLPHIFSRAAALVYPSVYEGFGLVFLFCFFLFLKNEKSFFALSIVLWRTGPVSRGRLSILFCQSLFC